jgi:O-antigen ligase
MEQQKQRPEAQNLKIANSGAFLFMVVSLPFDSAMFHFSSFLLLITALFSVLSYRWETLQHSLGKYKSVHVAFLAIVLLMCLSNLLNQQGLEAWDSTVKFIIRYWLMLATLLYLLDQKFLTLRFILFAALSSIAAQLLPFLPLIWSGDIFGTRFQGFTSNPNIMGIYTGLGIMIGVYLAADKNSGMPILRLLIALAVILLSGAALIASGSRAGWVALIGGLACYMVFELRRNATAIMLALAFISIATAYIFTQFSVPKQRLELLLKGYPALRDRIWENSLHLFTDRPFFGYGLDTRAALLQNHHVYSEHNIILSVLLALGAFGLLAYCALLFTICWPALKNRDAVGLSAMTFLMGVGMFGFDFYADQNFMVCFIIVSVLCLERSHKLRN